MDTKKLEERLLSVEDKFALKELVDSYLTAADKRDSEGMASYFTENGTLTSIMKEGTIELTGRKGIAEGFTKILAPLSKAYHFNGQFVTHISGAAAKGISYCFVILAGTKENQHYTRKIWAKYIDHYIRVNGQWLIESRLATVEHEEWEYQENNN